MEGGCDHHQYSEANMTVALSSQHGFSDMKLEVRRLPKLHAILLASLDYQSPDQNTNSAALQSSSTTTSSPDQAPLTPRCMSLFLIGSLFPVFLSLASAIGSSRSPLIWNSFLWRCRAHQSSTNTPTAMNTPTGAQIAMSLVWPEEDCVAEFGDAASGVVPGLGFAALC